MEDRRYATHTTAVTDHKRTVIRNVSV